MWRRVSPWAAIFLRHREAPDWHNTRASTLYPLLWPRQRSRRQGRRLGRGKTLHLVTSDLATMEKIDKLLIPQMLADTRQFTRKISSACERRINTCPLPSTWIYSALQFCRWGFVLPSHFLVVPSPLWPESCSSWPRCPLETPWILGIFLLSLRRRMFLDWASCCNSEGCWMFPKGLPIDLPSFGFLLVCHKRRLGHFS